MNRSNQHDVPSFESETSRIDEKDNIFTPMSDSPPEGGTRAWFTTLGVSFVMFVTYGMLLAFGSFQDYYTRVILSNYTPSDVSWIGSTQTFLLYVMGLFTGKWFDDGYFHRMVIPGTVIYLISFFMLSLCKPQQYYQFLLSQGIGMGLGMGLLAIPCISILSQYFDKRRGFANGTAFIATPLAGIVWPIMLNKLIPAIGFAWSVRIAAFISLGLLLAANILIRPRVSNHDQVRVHMLQGIKRSFMDVPYILCVLGLFLTGLGLLFPYNYLQLFASLHSFSADISQYTLAIMFSSTIVLGRVLPGVLGDRFGLINVVLAYTVIGGGLIFMLFGVNSEATLIVFAVLYGPCGGVYQSLFPACVRSYTEDSSDFGLRFGFGAIIYGVSTLIGSPINGALLHPPEYRWGSATIFSGTTVMIGCAALLASRQLLVRKQNTKSVSSHSST